MLPFYTLSSDLDNPSNNGTFYPNLGKFNILDYLESLDIIKESGSEIECHCPTCGAKNFKIDRKTGKYFGWSCNCTETEAGKKEIRDIVAPLPLPTPGKRRGRGAKTLARQVSVKPKTAPSPIKGEISLARLMVIPSDFPTAQKPDFIPKRVLEEAQKAGASQDTITQTIYRYSPTQFVARYDWPDPEKDKGRNKTFCQFTISTEGERIWGKGEEPWPLYRETEALSSQGWHLFQEGEECVEAARKLGLVSITSQGSSWGQDAISDRLAGRQAAGVLGVVYFADNDPTGLEKAQKVEAAAGQIGFPCVTISIKDLWPDAPQGADLADWIQLEQNQDMNTEDFIRRLELEIHAAVERRNQESKQQVQLILEEEVTFEADLKTLCFELLASGLCGADYEDEINRIAQETKTHSNEIRRLVESIDKDVAQLDARPETLGELILLNDAEKHSIALGEVIPEWLAGPINNLAGALNIRPETYLLPLLCGLSGTFKRGTRLIVDQRLGFEVSPQLYGAIVAPSSQKKSPVLNAVGLKALSLLQSQANQNYQAALDQYRQDCARYKSLSGEDLETEFPDGPPKEPTMEVYFSDSLTVEGLLSDISKQERGISIFCDELSGFFLGLNQYKKSGNDAQRFLEFYDGKSTLIQRKKDGPTFIENPVVSIAGGIQPSVLEGLFKNGDGSGQWARFMFVRQPAAAAELSLDGVTYDLSGMINPLYQSFADLPAMTFNLTQEARALYFEHYNRYEQERVAKPDHPLSNVWGKACGWIGKLAIILHCITYHGAEIPELIGADVIAQAVKLTDFFISQSRVLYAELMGGAGNQLSAQLNKVLNLAGRNGGSCTARDVLRAKIAKKTPDAIALFEELKGMGLGTVSKDGRSIRFSLPKPMSPNVTPLSPDCHSECHQFKPLQDKDLGEIVTNVTQNFQIQNVTTPATTPEISLTPTAPTFPPSQKSLSTKDGDIGDNVALTQSGQTIGVGDNSGDNSGDIAPSGDNSGDIDPQPYWPGPMPVNARGEVDHPVMSRYNKAQIAHLGWTKEQARSFAKELTGKERREDMTDDELIKVTQAFNKLCAEHNPHAY